MIRVYYVLYKRKVEKSKRKVKECLRLVEETKKALMESMDKERKMERQQGEVGEEKRGKEREKEDVEESIQRIRGEIEKMEREGEERVENVETREGGEKEEEDRQKERREEARKEYSRVHREGEEARERYEEARREYARWQVEAGRSEEERKLLAEEGRKRAHNEAEKKKRDLEEMQKELDSRRVKLEERTAEYRALEEKKERLVGIGKTLVAKLAAKQAEKSEESLGLTMKGADVSTLRRRRAEARDEVSESKKAFDVKGGEIPVGGIIRLLEEADRRGIQGVYGILLDMVEVPEKISMAFEALLSKHLFTIVVDTEDTASKLISLNREMRGGKILVSPMSWVEPVDSCFAYPDESECIPLEHHTESKEAFRDLQGIRNLIVGITRGNILVETLEAAQLLSKRYECNCVTMEGEVVFKKGFLNRLGFSNLSDSKMQDYLKYCRLRAALKEVEESFKREEQKYEEMKTRDGELQVELNDLVKEKDGIMNQHEGVWREMGEVMRACIVEKKIVDDLIERVRTEDGLIESLRRDLESFEVKLIYQRRLWSWRFGVHQEKE